MHEQQTTSLQRPYCRLGALALLAVSVLCVSKVAYASSYSALPDSDKAYIKRVCAPIQYQQDTASYRNCVEQHSQAILTANRTPIAQLDFDEQLHVQQACTQYGAINTAEYSQCAVAEADSLEDILAADVSALSEDDIFAARQSCRNTDGGVKAYRQCVNSAVDEIKALVVTKAELPVGAPEAQDGKSVAAIETSVVAPVAAIEPAATVEPATMVEPLTAIEPVNVEPVATKPLVVDSVTIKPAAIESAASKPPAIEPISSANTTVSANTNISQLPATNNAIRVNTIATENVNRQTVNTDSAAAALLVAEAPVETSKPVEILTPVLAAAEPVTGNAQAAEPDTVESDTREPDAREPDAADDSNNTGQSASDIAENLKARLMESLEGVTGVNRIILLAALALPLLLLVFWLLMRRGSDKSEDNLETYSRMPDVRASGNTLDSTGDHTADATNNSLSTQQLQFEDQMGDLFADGKHESEYVEDEAPDFDEIDATIDINKITDELAEPIPSSSLGTLLKNHDKEDQLGLVIEFMIYWMAFTDERYVPELKAKIFAEKDPDDHDLIKRSVLSHDFGAFADSIAWLQQNTAIEQREQILKLLMALLVYEEGVTPVQNTTLRFLCNAFGLTHTKLDEFFQEGFGHALPSMPRPDKPSWWKKQSEDKLRRWDARSVAQQPASIQARVKLGLPLSGELDPQSVSARHKRAISRCQAKNFDLLTSREQQLAESQQAKYDSAAEVLTENPE